MKRFKSTLKKIIELLVYSFMIAVFIFLIINFTILLFSLFHGIINSARIPGTLFDQLFTITTHDALFNVLVSFLIIFMSVAISMIALVLFEKIFKRNTLVIQSYIWKLFLPATITLWLTMVLDEQGFMIVTSLVAFLGLLAPLVKTPKLSSFEESDGNS